MPAARRVCTLAQGVAARCHLQGQSRHHFFKNNNVMHLSNLRWPNKPLNGAPAQALAEGAHCLPRHRLLQLQHCRHMPSIRTHSPCGTWSALAASQSGSDPACTHCLPPHAVQGQTDENSIVSPAHALARPAAHAPACPAASYSNDQTRHPAGQQRFPAQLLRCTTPSNQAIRCTGRQSLSFIDEGHPHP